MAQTTERIRFSLISMPCCGQLLCWVNPRLPNYCPECGKAVWISNNRQHIISQDDEAMLKLKVAI